MWVSVIKTKSMSSQFHVKKEITSITTKPNNNNINGMLPPPLKINKYSHFIKKSTSSSSPPSSSSSSSSSTSSSHINSIVASNKPPQQHRQPVIIYTHSPRVISTNRKNFMALVQKLTGLTHTEEDDDSADNGCNPPSYHQPKQEPGRENNCSSNNIGENQLINAADPPMYEPPLNPYTTNLSDFMCSNQLLWNFSDSFGDY